MRWLLLASFVLTACGSTAAGSSDDGGAPVETGPRPPPAPPPTPDPPPPPLGGPERLSQTGLYADLATRTLAPRVHAYTPRYELWSDGADKSRWFLLPEGTQIDTKNPDDWTFPTGTIVWKEFRVAGKPIETRVLWKKRAGNGSIAWWMMAYAWNAEGTDAIAVPEGVRNAAGTTHDVPPQRLCDECHQGAADVVLGVSALQLAAPEGKGALSALAAEGLLTAPPAAEPQVPGTGVVQDALGYIHANCAHCHNEGGGPARQSPLRLWVNVAAARPEDTPIYRTALNTPMKHTMAGNVDRSIVPGQPERSQLWLRMKSRDLWAMPPTATEQIDPKGVEAIRAWIAGLP